MSAGVASYSGCVLVIYTVCVYAQQGYAFGRISLRIYDDDDDDVDDDDDRIAVIKVQAVKSGQLSIQARG